VDYLVKWQGRQRRENFSPTKTRGAEKNKRKKEEKKRIYNRKLLRFRTEKVPKKRFLRCHWRTSRGKKTELKVTLIKIGNV